MSLDVEMADAAAGGAGKRRYVRRIFSDIAPRYDLLNHLLSFNIDRHWRRAGLAALGWERRPSGLYVDLCSGTMDVAAMLAHDPAFTGRVIAADFAEPMLRAGVPKARAGKRRRHAPVGWTALGCRRAPCATVSPVVADALDLPLSDASVDGAIVAFGIRNVADLAAGLAEARRVLKPGARFVILEFSTPPSALVRAAYHTYFYHVLPALGAAISGNGTAYRYLPRSVANFPSGERLAFCLRDAGFGSVTWRPLTLGVAALHVGERT